MHPNPAFRKEAESRALDFAARRGFGHMAEINQHADPVHFLHNFNAKGR